MLLKPWSPRPVICCQPHKPAETRREKPQAVNRRLKEPFCTPRCLSRRSSRRRRGKAAEAELLKLCGTPQAVYEDGYVKRTAPMDKRQFRKYTETCRKLGFRFDRGSSRWRSCSHLQRYKPATAGLTPFMDRLVEAVVAHLCRHRASACSVSCPA